MEASVLEDENSLERPGLRSGPPRGASAASMPSASLVPSDHRMVRGAASLVPPPPPPLGEDGGTLEVTETPRPRIGSRQPNMSRQQQDLENVIAPIVTSFLRNTSFEQKPTSLTMVDADRMENEHLWIHRFDPRDFRDIRREAEEIVDELHRQRSQRGLWYPPRLQQLPILLDKVVRALAINPISVENVCYIWELNYRDTMEAIPNVTAEEKRKRQELTLALSPFLTRHDFVCSLCCLGFATKAGLLSHLRSRCWIKRYPEHSALLHWAHHIARTEMDIPEHLVRIFEEEKIRVRTTYTTAEVSRTYSRLATSVGLLSLLLEDSRKDESRNNLRDIFEATMQALTPNAPSDAELIVSLTTEFLGLQV